METKIYNQKGEATGSFKTADSVFGLDWNADLVHQVALSMRTAMRKPYAHTKTRGEVSGGGRKPWKQKGLGRARHGSTRSPIWVGGGIAHGPITEKSFDRKINKKMKVRALLTLLSKKFKDGEVLFVDDISAKGGKTKEAKTVINALGKIAGFTTLHTKKNNSALIVLPEYDIMTVRGFRNFGSMAVGEARSISPIDLLTYKYVIISKPELATKVFEQKMSQK